jgi:VWFA-related protein
MSRLAWLAVSLATVLCSAGVAAGQDDDPPLQPTFRAGVGIVQVPVIVRDRQGQPVYGLPRDVFTVLDRGRPMTLVGFEEVRRVDHAPPMPREIVLVIDDLNTRPEVMPRAIQAARELLPRLDPDDRVALINTSTFPDIRREATTSHVIISRDLDRIRGQSTIGTPRFWAIQQSLSVLRSLFEQLATEATGSRRYTVVLFSEGYGFNPFDQTGWVDLEILRDVRAITGRAAQANASIYAIHAAGLEIGGGGFRGRSTRVVGNPIGTSGGFAFGSSLSTIDDLSALAALAHDTGGRLTRWTNDLLANVPQMLSDVDEYYLLSYEMPEVTDEERRARVPLARQLDVRVNRPGVQVRARQSYVHPEGIGRQGR